MPSTGMGVPAFGHRCVELGWHRQNLVAGPLTRCVRRNVAAASVASPDPFSMFPAPVTMRTHACRFATLPAVLSDAEMAAEIDPVYAKFMAGEVDVPGRDLCDMSGAKARAAA